MNSGEEINIFRPESHVAQQRRRDKLRNNIPQSTTHHLQQQQDVRNHFLQLPPTTSAAEYDPPMFSSEMLRHHHHHHHHPLLLAHNNNNNNNNNNRDGDPSAGKPVGLEYAHAVSPLGSRLATSQNPCYWKGVGSYDSWGVAYQSADNASNQEEDLLFVGGTLPATTANLSSSSNSPKPGCTGYQYTNSPSATSKLCGELNFTSPVFQNALHGTTDMPSQGCQMLSLVHQTTREPSNSSWLDAGNDELLPRPTYGNASRVNETDSSMHRLVVEGWNGKLAAGTNTSRWDVDTCADSKVSFKNNSGDNLATGVVGSSSTYPCRSIGPLGPFTGYATVLKNSNFLKPAQQLLDEICSVTGSKFLKTCKLSESGSKEITSSSSPLNAEKAIGPRGGNSGFSSSSMNSSNEGCEEGSGRFSCQTNRPEFQQKKAKLLYMQEEICRRYRQYHQQMQLVVSSFEVVVGLSSATPYASLALKKVSRHFRFLKNAISEQLRHISKVLGEDLLSPSTPTSSKGGVEIPRFKCIDQNLQKQKAHFLEPQQPIWRPQRGLPERAVAVLRAWLFEHFLHPYPTDTDKQMLATQTGLSRNQVSNWFINARVRLWKPMVEEMHMLESNGDVETQVNPSSKNNDGQMGERLKIDHHNTSDKHSAVEERGSLEQLFREKRSRIECESTPPPGAADGGLLGFLPYHQRGLGSVSLTLGLRHSTDQQQQLRRRHYGSHMIHDFVG